MTLTTTTLKLPALTDNQWKMALSVYASKVDIPTGEQEQFRSDWTGTEMPSKTKLLTAMAIDCGVDELPYGDPRQREVLGPFMDLTEAEAMTVLFVNNIFWETREALWRSENVDLKPVREAEPTGWDR